MKAGDLYHIGNGDNYWVAVALQASRHGGSCLSWIKNSKTSTIFPDNYTYFDDRILPIVERPTS